MPKLPKGWVPGKGIPSRRATPDLFGQATGQVSDPTRRIQRPGSEKPKAKKPLIERIREKTPLEWAAVGFTILVVSGIAHMTFSTGPDAVADARSVTAARRTKAPGRNLGPSSWVKISNDETPPVGFAFMPPPKASASSEEPTRPEWVDILPLVKYEDPSQRELLEKSIKSIQGEAWKELTHSGSRPVPYLIAVLEFGLDHENSDPNQLVTVVSALGKISDRFAESAVLKAARSSRAEVREAALVALTEGKHPEAIELAIEGLADDSMAMRMRSEQVLRDAGHKGREAVVEALRFSAWEVDEAVTRAVTLFSMQPISDAVAPLCNLLRHPSAAVRRSVIRTFGTWGEALPRDLDVVKDWVRSSLEDDDATVRGQAALTLLSLGDSGELAQLVDLLKDPEENVRKSAEQALVGMTGLEDLAGSHEAWTRHLEDKNVR